MHGALQSMTVAGRPAGDGAASNTYHLSAGSAITRHSYTWERQLGPGQIVNLFIRGAQAAMGGHPPVWHPAPFKVVSPQITTQIPQAGKLEASGT